jgi:hypothetical protein
MTSNLAVALSSDITIHEDQTRRIAGSRCWNQRRRAARFHANPNRGLMETRLPRRQARETDTPRSLALFVRYTLNSAPALQTPAKSFSPSLCLLSSPVRAASTELHIDQA